MAVLASNINGHIQNQLTRSLEKILEDANQSGELKLSNRKLKDFPKASSKYNLSDTVIADLSKNRFSELPEEVSEFPFLERLHCYHNAIRHIPDSISSLQCLNYVDLSRNQLTALPREICLLPIQILLVSNNKLSSLPDELYKMSQLTELDASCNQLTHLPPRMGDLVLLQSLVLRNNLLLCLPVEITYLNLVRLDLGGNRISTLPVEMRNMISLIHLSVEDNPLTCPPACLCRRGQVHIFKYLETEAIKIEQKTGLIGTGTLGRKSRRSAGCTAGTLASHLPERLKNKRHNVDSGYCTSSDGYDKRWSQEMAGDSDSNSKSWTSTPIMNRAVELNGTHSALSTPSTVSPSPDIIGDDDTPKISDIDRRDEYRPIKDVNSVRLSPNLDNSTLINGNGTDEKAKSLRQIQTYKEYKEALKQQRAQDVPSIYRTKDSEDNSYKTEPNTPTHTNHSTLATSKSDPTPLNSALSNPKSIFDDKPFRHQHLTVRSYSPTNTLTNGNSDIKNGSPRGVASYIKPKSPVKGSGGILSHDNVPTVMNCSSLTNGKGGGKTGYLATASMKNVNGVKSGRSVGWNKEIAPEKMSFTMRREIDKAREETDLINQLRNIIETRLKMVLPEDLAPALTDGVVLCHLANHIKPRSVASIHVPSPAVPKLTMARCRRNVDNFIEACRKIGVDEEHLCSSVDVSEGLASGRGLPRLLDTLEALCLLEEQPQADPPPRNQHNDTTVSLLLLAVFISTLILLILFPPPD